ncbi:hypothetical protein MHK_001525 [Candidatus Magnetomorum sp. HK-1]|nr:hypothetical protein MHK_001525 [Candidatus Magnetomorum sp. HK-1]
MMDPIPTLNIADESFNEYHITIDLQKVLLNKDGSLILEKNNDKW